MTKTRFINFNDKPKNISEHPFFKHSQHKPVSPLSQNSTATLGVDVTVCLKLLSFLSRILLSYQPALIIAEDPTMHKTHNINQESRSRTYNANISEHPFFKQSQHKSVLPLSQNSTATLGVVLGCVKKLFRFFQTFYLSYQKDCSQQNICIIMQGLIESQMSRHNFLIIPQSMSSRVDGNELKGGFHFKSCFYLT